MKTMNTTPGINRRMTTSEINELSLKRYKGPIVLIRNVSELNQCINSLKKEPVLGFDIETRPAFKKGQSFPPALLQLACKNEVYIIQLKTVGLPNDLVQILEDPAVTKVGVSVQFDINKLKELKEFQEQGFIDLADIAKNTRLKNFGLRGLVAVLLGFRIPKGAQKSNWAKKDLTEKQIHYAATDAWAGRELFFIMKEKGMV